MALLTFSNLSPAGSALQSKINPLSLFPPKNNNYGGLFSTGSASTPLPKSSGLLPSTQPAPNMSTVNGPVYAPPPSPSTPTPLIKTPSIATPKSATQTSPATGVNSDHISGLIKSVQDLQKNVFNYANQKNNPTPAPSTPATSPTPYQGAVGTLNSIASNPNGDYGLLQEKIRQIRENAAKNIAGVNTSGADLGFKQGEEAQIRLAEAAKEGALGQEANALLGQQGQQIQAAEGAGSLAQPVQVSYSNAYIDPTTGLPYGNTSGASLNNAIAQAVQLVKNGADPQGSSVQALLAPFSAPGQQAFNQALQQVSNGTYNPTTFSAISQQNAALGQQYQGEALQLSTTLKQLDTLTPTVTKFLSDAGLNNQNSPFFNKAIKAYQAQLTNPADITSLNAMLSDVKTYTAQILGSSGLNPTEVSATVNSFDPSNLNAQQLQSFLSNLRNLGQIRLQPLQQTSQTAYGSGNPVLGSAANPSVNSTLTPNNPEASVTTNNPIIQGLIGGGINTFGGIENFITGLASTILK